MSADTNTILAQHRARHDERQAVYQALLNHNLRDRDDHPPFAKLVEAMFRVWGVQGMIDRLAEPPRWLPKKDDDREAWQMAKRAGLGGHQAVVRLLREVEQKPIGTLVVSWLRERLALQVECELIPPPTCLSQELPTPPPTTVEGILAELNKMRDGLEKEMNSGVRHRPVAIPNTRKLWEYMPCTRLGGVPIGGDPPKDAVDAMEKLDKVEKWCHEHGTTPPNFTPRHSHFELVPGGFRYKGGKIHNLVGQPRDMLKELLDAEDRRCRAAHLAKVLCPNGTEKSNDQHMSVKQAASRLRKTLRDAMRKDTESFVGSGDTFPLTSVGKNKDLTYYLEC